jgi:hypothetical protein
MKTRSKIKNLRIALLTAFLIMFSFSGFSQACPGNQLTLSIKNLAQTSTTLEYDVFVRNTGSTSIKLSALAGNVRFPTGMLTTGTLTVVEQPSATGNFSGIANLAPNLTIASQQARWTNTPPVGEAVAVPLPANSDLKFARFRITNTGTPWSNFPAQLTLSTGGTGISLNIVTVYCNGNPSSTPISLATSTIALENPNSIVLGPGNICFSTGSAATNPESCTGLNDGIAIITMSPIPTDLSASYILDGGAAVPVTLTSGGAFTITGLSTSAHTLSITGSGTCTTPVSVPFTIGTTTAVTPTFSQVTPICSGDVLAALPTTSTNGVIGTWAPALNNTTTTSYTFTPDSGECATTATMTITVNPSITPTFTQVAPICSGITLTALPTTSSNAITGTWSPALNNTTTTTYTFTPDAGQCATTATMTITVNPSTNVTTTISACGTYTWSENGVTYTTSGVYTIPGTLQSGIFNNASTWASTAAANGAVVSTNALSGLPQTPPASVTVGSTSVTFSAPGGLYSSGTFVGTNSPNEPLTMTFTPPVYGVAGNYFVTNITDNVIAGTITIAYSNGTTDTQAVSAVTDYFGFFNGSSISSVTITPVATAPAVNRYVSINNLSVAVAPACFTETLDLTIIPQVTPAFTQVSPICLGATLAALPTTSTNSIIGTWTPAIDNTATTTYTFTPTVGQCATTATMTITVNQPTVPTFTQVAPICSGATLAALPTTSNNAITGAWSPVISNTATTTYTFTPDAGQCATTSTMTIVVNPLPIVTFSANPFPVCAGTSSVLSANVNNATPTISTSSQTFSMNAGLIGTPITTPLTGSLINTITNGCDPFTPGSLNGKIALIQRGTCAFSVKVQNAQDAGAVAVVIYNNVAGVIIPGGTAPTVTIPVYGITLADGQALIAGMTANEVNVTLNPAPPVTYLWGNGDTTQTTNTGVLNANTDFTVTVTSTLTGCSSTTTVTVPVTPLTVPTFNTVAAICAGETLAALPTTSTNSIVGTWAPALNNTTTTTYTFTPTPVTGQCLGTATLTITVNPLTTNGSVTTTACGSYTWPANGVTYTTNQTGITFVTGCNTATLNLTIQAIDYANLQFPDTQTLCEGQTLTAYGRVYEAGITDVSQTLQGAGIDVEFGLSTAGGSADPSTWTNWSTATYNAASLCYPCNDDEYQFTTSNTLTAGTYYYTFRYKLSSCTTWQYGGYPNGFWNGTNQNSGVLTINPATTNGSITTTACDTYTWPANGVTYTSSQTNLTHVVGCNTATLNLTITPSTTNGSVTTTACNSYTWPANGVTYTTSQTNLTNVVGCNTATLNLTITTAATPTGSATQSFSVAALNDATIANLVVNPTAVTWYGSLADAQSGTNPLPTTTVLTNGATYWAVNTVATCASTPFGVTVTVTLGNDDFDSLNFAYYPNPTSSTLNISYSKTITEIQVTNMLGQVILTKKTNETEVQVDLAPFAEATYFVKVTSDDQSKIVKVIKRN